MGRRLGVEIEFTGVSREEVVVVPIIQFDT